MAMELLVRSFLPFCLTLPIVMLEIGYFSFHLPLLSFFTSSSTFPTKQTGATATPSHPPVEARWKEQRLSRDLPAAKRSTSEDRERGGVYREILPKPDNLISKALYTFDIGQNDLAAGYFDNMTTDQVEAYVPDLMKRLASAIQTVYNLGGRYFWVHNTGTLGCLPYALANRPDLATEKDGAGCSVALNAGPRFFNARLKETVARLRVDLLEAAFTYVDVYTAMYRLMSEDKKIGFGDPLRVCCGYGDGEYNYDKVIGCCVKVEVNGTVLEGKSCEDPSKSVSWDGVHLTEAAYKFIFDQIVDGALSDPPVPLRRACQAKTQ